MPQPYVELRKQIEALADGTRGANEISDTLKCRREFVVNYARSRGLPLLKDAPRITAPVGDWTNPAVVDELRRLHSEKFTCADIARVMNKKFRTSFSRNAILGKLFRLGLSNNLARPTRPPAPKRKRPAKQAPKFVFGPGYKPDIKPEPMPLPVVRPDDVARKSLVDLEPQDCRWPVGDPRSPDFGFCALPKVPGHSYCAGHCAVGFQSVPVRRLAPVISNDNVSDMTGQPVGHVKEDA